MKIPVELAQLNAPFFHITGKNLGERLDTRNNAALKLEYDTETKELAIAVNGRVGFCVGDNVRGYFPFVEPPMAKVIPVEPRPVQRRTAQASTPQDHVHAGLGAGIKNDK